MPSGELRYDEALRKRLTTNLQRRAIVEHEAGDGVRRAAVAIIVIDSDATTHGVDAYADSGAAGGRMPEIPGVEPGELSGSVAGTAGGAAIVLTRRTARLSTHASQWALPGGRVDQGETPLEAALRETSEEVGLQLGDEAVLGRLDDYPTRSGYVISPFVIWAGADAEPVANPDEVASIHRIGCHELARQPRFVSIPESDRPVIQLPIGGDLIHAPTGAVIHQFWAVGYEGRDLRVDGFEQPVFAWG